MPYKEALLFHNIRIYDYDTHFFHEYFMHFAVPDFCLTEYYYRS